jgi:hypothetical protein
VLCHFLQGKSSKHHHSVAYSQAYETLLEAGSFHFDAAALFPVPEEFHGSSTSFECLNTHEPRVDHLSVMTHVCCNDVQNCWAGVVRSCCRTTRTRCGRC